MNMKTSSLIALFGTVLVILSDIVHALLTFVAGYFGLGWLYHVAGCASFILKLVGLMLIGAFFFASWRNQK